MASEKRKKADSDGADGAKKHKEAVFELKSDAHCVTLGPNTNQALGIAHYAIKFLEGSLGTGPDEAVFKRVELFHTDSVVCGLSAIAMRTNAPTVLREEAENYPAPKTKYGANLFGSKKMVHAEKAIVANVAAVREWDSNGTVFGFNSKLAGHTAGEFGHNDFYPVVIAACTAKGFDGKKAALGMIAIDEIRGRLAEVFSLKTFKLDHVVHGAIASAAVYGALLGATPEQIEHAIGMVVAHYIPWRAIRAGHQLSDSKGASAAISTEVAILSVKRAMGGFIGPKDIFRNQEAIFRFFKPTKGDTSPFDLVLTHSGNDFAVMGMHFKLGLYEHQSAGALQGLIDVLRAHPELVGNGQSTDEKAPSTHRIKSIKIVCYEPAFGIIGDPAKRDPHTRQSADHSMVFIVSRKLKHAIELGKDKIAGVDNDSLWKNLFLAPVDYSKDAIFDPVTRSLMDKIVFEHGGKEYDDKYPDGIPTSIVITDVDNKVFSSGMVMYPAGHARNTAANLEMILDNKFRRLGELAVGAEHVEGLLEKFRNLKGKSFKDVNTLYSHIDIKFAAEALE